MKRILHALAPAVALAPARIACIRSSDTTAFAQAAGCARIIGAD